MKAKLRNPRVLIALAILCVFAVQSTLFAQGRGLFFQFAAVSETYLAEPIQAGLEMATSVVASIAEAVTGSSEPVVTAQQTMAAASAQAANSLEPVTLASGSYIVNMGVNAQTKPAGLKPYGMLYDLIKNHSVPVYWVINPAKVKDGVDFSYNGVAYRGGTLVIDKKYITTAVATVISQWTGSTLVNNKGLVVGAYTTSSLTITPAYRLTAAPKWTLDAANGGIAVGFFNNASIPSSAYVAQLPARLGACDDIYVMPHADPKWASHSNLYNWNLTHKGAIWAACHAVSALENMYNPANISQQTNFLSTKRSTTGTAGDPVAGSTSYAQNSLVLWGNHNNGTPPYNTVTGSITSGTLATPADPVAQFIGAPDAAMLNGSEQIYMPVLEQGWRSTTKVITYDPTQADVPSKSPGPAVAIAYGRGFGEANRGLVMYEGGHSIDKGTTGDVPAQRAFFNFSFLATIDKAPILNSVTGVPANGIINGTTVHNFSVNATFQVPPTAATYTWSFRRADNGDLFGTFSPNSTATAASTTYTPPANVASNVPGILTVKINDGCGRETFESFAVTVTPGPRPPVANADVASIRTECNTPGQPVTISVLDNDTDPDGEVLTVSSVSGGNGTWTTNGTTVTFAPAADFNSGSVTGTYTVRDAGGLTASASITVNLGTPDAQGCYPGSVYGVAQTTAATTATASATGVTNPTNALGSSDYDPADAISYAVVTTGNLVLEFSSVLEATNRKLVVSFSSANTTSTTIQVEGRSSSTGTFTVICTAAANDPSLSYETSFNLPAGGLQAVRITRVGTAGTLRVDAAEVETYSCVPNSIRANNDEVRINEDIAATVIVLDNDTNPGNQALTLTIAQQPVNGKLSLNPDNTFTYLNNRDYNGNDSFRYRVCNSQGICSEGLVTITVVADGCGTGSYKPLGTANPVTFTLQNPSNTATNVEDAWIKADSGGDDNYSEATSVDVGKIPTKARRAIFRFNNAFATLPADAVITNATFSIFRIGGENATYEMSAYRLTETWPENGVTWLYRDKNANPRINWTTPGGTVNDVIVSSASSTPVPGFKDFNVTSLVQGWRAGSYPNNGLLIRRANPTVDDKFHTFASSENGTAANRPKLVITYVVPLACALIPNRAPLANPDYATTNSSTLVSVPVLANDADVDVPVQTLNIGSIVSVTSGAGTAVVDPANNRNIRFTPTATFTGTAQIRYSVTDGSLTDEAIAYVTVSRSAPAANRDNATILSGATATINTAANDLNPSNLSLSDLVIVNNPKKGSANFSGTTLTYIPAPGFYGLDTLVYRRCEALNPAICNQQILCDTALVVIKVDNRAPVAVNDIVSFNRCQPVTIDVLKNDSDPEGGILAVAIVQAPTKGTVTVSGTEVNYTPNSNFNSGSDVFTYRICDDASPALCATASVTLNINSTAVNNAPVAVNDEATGIVFDPIYIDVLTNDNDPDDNELVVSLPATGLKAQNGTVEVLSNGLILYTPNNGFKGTDAFEYTICDVINFGGAGCGPAVSSLCATALVTVTVNDMDLVPQGVLPVELMSFTAAAKGTVVELVWKTATEKNNDKFLIERSTNGHDYEVIGSKKGNGTSTRTISYSFTDHAPSSGISYYRLKQIDLDGKFAYSVVRAVNSSGNNQVQLQAYPNPFSSFVTVTVTAPIAEKAQLQLFDMQGRVVLTIPIELNQGQTQLGLNLEAIAVGVYTLRVAGNNIETKARVIKSY